MQKYGKFSIHANFYAKKIEKNYLFLFFIDIGQLQGAKKRGKDVFFTAERRPPTKYVEFVGGCVNNGINDGVMRYRWE